MGQFDVFVNPVASLRRVYPYLVVLQSSVGQSSSHDHVVAPIVPRGSLDSVAGRLTPAVTIESVPSLVLVPVLSTIRRTELKQPIATLATERSALMAAIDYLFFGV
jgi:hypothetical protein